MPGTDPSPSIEKVPTGIAGLDELSWGGLPRGRTTLVEGEPGSGKTLLGLQTLVEGARRFGEPGIFVAFEESSRRIVANAATFGWDLARLEKDGLFFLDAQPDINLVTSGDFDLGGLLAALQGKVREMGAKRIVFDALDIVLALFDSTREMRREAYRLHSWLLAQELTAILTAKAGADGRPLVSLPHLDFVEFMVDCSMGIHHETVGGVSHRRLRIRKYRGSGFEENDAPMAIGEEGIQVAHFHPAPGAVGGASRERVSSGVDRLDRMLGGGYFRKASVLITGAPGTAKTTLSGAFACAAAARGEKTLFVSYDSEADEIVRNLASVDIDLKPHIDAGLLQVVSARALRFNAEIQLMRIRRAVERFGAVNLVIDPASALSKGGNEPFAAGIMERLAVWAKQAGITLVLTSLLDQTRPELESTELQISTIADTWIHLSYRVHAGERNRGLTIVKSRGTEHSNQVRELVLRSDGVSIEDVYTAGGEVLMGTERRVRERREAAERRHRRTDLEERRAEIDTALEQLEASGEASDRLRSLRAERSRIERLLERELADYEAMEGEIFSMRTGDDER